MAGSIAEVTQHSIAGDFTKYNPKNSKIILLEGSDQVLNRYPEDLSKRAKDDLEKMGVDVRLNRS